MGAPCHGRLRMSTHADYAEPSRELDIGPLAGQVITQAPGSA